jgi:hypothetical protein
MDKKEAVAVIRNNWPPEQYSMLREALELSIKALEAVEGAPSASDNKAMDKICPFCNGGRVYRITNDDGNGRKCDECGGTGKLHHS